jgi:hypothetical protein
MGVFTDAGKNEMLDASTITHAALFNGDPSGAGSEVTGGAPAYARQAITLPSASGGSIVVSTDATFDVPSGATVNYVGYFTAITGGTLLAYDDVTEETFGAQGQYILDSSTFSI